MSALQNAMSYKLRAVQKMNHKNGSDFKAEMDSLLLFLFMLAACFFSTTG
jgi:hypothetical protein